MIIKHVHINWRPILNQNPEIFFTFSHLDSFLFNHDKTIQHFYILILTNRFNYHLIWIVNCCQKKCHHSHWNTILLNPESLFSIEITIKQKFAVGCSFVLRFLLKLFTFVLSLTNTNCVDWTFLFLIIN